MKNNILYGVLLLVVGMIALQSCQNDPDFPDPNFELKDQRVEVRRDTADVYTISMDMDVPNKVESISLIDAMDYTEIEEIQTYNGKSKFEFNYDLDLTPFEKDTVLNYIVKVTDLDNRSFNQGIRIDVKGFSFPEVKLVGGTNIAVAAPAYVVKGIVSTGLNNIARVTISFEGEEQYSYVAVAAEPLSELSLKELIFLGALEEGVAYDLDIYIEDDKGQSSVTTITVFKNDSLSKPVRVNYTNIQNVLVNIDFEYDEQGRISAFDYIWPDGDNDRHEFSYNELNMVDTLYLKNYTDGELVKIEGLYFNYNPGTTQLLNVEEQIYEYEGGLLIEQSDAEVISDSYVYDSEGNITSLYTNSEISDIYYSDPFGLGESVFGEFWQSTGYMTNSGRRQHFSEYDPVLIPTFIEGMPPIHVLSSTTFLLFNDIFWSKYMMTKTVHTNDDYRYLAKPAYTYETDNDGNITNITRIYTSGGYYYEGDFVTYNFFY